MIAKNIPKVLHKVNEYVTLYPYAGWIVAAAIITVWILV